MNAHRAGPISSQDAPHVLLTKKLRRYDSLSDAEVGVLKRAIAWQRTFVAGQEIVRIDDKPAFSCLLVEGWTARSKTVQNGARQITALHIPGDFVDLHSFMLHKMDHSIVALTSCRIAAVPHECLRRISEDNPHLTRLFWLNTVIDSAIHRNWVAALGRLPALKRTAQLFCELYVRLELVGLARNMEFELSLTQPVLADALGLSLVHVNRSLQEIRKLELLSLRGQTVRIVDWDRLASFAQFDPTYLSLKSEPR